MRSGSRDARNERDCQLGQFLLCRERGVRVRINIEGREGSWKGKDCRATRTDALFLVLGSGSDLVKGGVKENDYREATLVTQPQTLPERTTERRMGSQQAARRKQPDRAKKAAEGCSGGTLQTRCREAGQG